jgi:DNA-binding GntR family transcriptional regulator
MISDAAGGNILSHLVSIFLDYTARHRKYLPASEAGAMVSLENHRAIVEAIRRGDKEKVERIAKSHILDPIDRGRVRIPDGRNRGWNKLEVSTPREVEGGRERGT